VGVLEYAVFGTLIVHPIQKMHKQERSSKLCTVSRLYATQTENINKKEINAKYYRICVMLIYKYGSMAPFFATLTIHTDAHHVIIYGSLN